MRDLSFRDESPRVRRRVEAEGAQAIAPSEGALAPLGIHIRGVMTSLEDLSVPFFLNSFFPGAEPDERSDARITLAERIRNAHSDKALFAAVNALGCATIPSAANDPNQLFLAEKNYGRAIHYVNQSLGSGSKYDPWNLLMTVLLLSYFEASSS